MRSFTTTEARDIVPEGASPCVFNFFWPFGWFSDFAPGQEVWYVSFSIDGLLGCSMYLHKDGMWRHGTLSSDKATGYFLTKEEAELALSQAMATGDPKPVNNVLADALRAAQVKRG